MLDRRVVAAIALLACSCGAPSPPPKSAAPAPAKAAAASDDDAPRIVRYATVRADWVETHLEVSSADAQTWSSDPSHARDLLPTFRHILVVVREKDDAKAIALAKKKIDLAMSRVKRGEDFARVAKDISEDPGSKDSGGAYPGSSTAVFVEPVRRAYDALPPGGMTVKGIEVRFENVPAGDEANEVRSTFVYAAPQGGEKPDATLARARGWLARTPHPVGTFYVVEPRYSETGTLDGYRSLLARESVIFDDRDVADAKVETRDASWPTVRLELTPAAAKRFEDATRDWTQRRIALLVDGLVTAAPIVKTAITGGHVEVIAPRATAEARKASAERVARTLRRH